MEERKQLRCLFCKGREFCRATKEIVEMFCDGAGIMEKVIDNCGIYYACCGCGQDVDISELKEVDAESRSSYSYVQEVKGGK